MSSVSDGRRHASSSPSGAGKDIGPFSRLVPVKLAVRVRRQGELGGGDVFGHREVGHGLFADPAAAEQAGLGVREGPDEVRDDSAVGRRAGQVVGVLSKGRSARAQ